MSDTATLKLPLLQPSQAQKHVTVNEALIRLDGLTQITILSRKVGFPPASPLDGDCYAVPTGASAEWSGQEGMLAIASNGGWIFVQPLSGWSAWIVDEHRRATFVQNAWQSGVLGAVSNGGLSRFVVAQAEHVIVPGGEQFIDLEVPENSMIFACSARVADPITGTATSWILDIASQTITFGTGMGLQAGSYCTGLLSQPASLYSAEFVRLAPDGGTFDGGRLQVAAHYYQIDVPS